MRPPRPGTGFTITELLVVITLIVILILIAVPSFQSMISSQEESLAENQLKGALRASRDAAVKSNGGNDSAAVFFFTPGGRLSVVTCVKVGEMADWADAAAAQGRAAPTSDNTTRREIFAPAPGAQVVNLPRQWMVRGYAPANALNNPDDDASWYGSSAWTGPDDRWVFPETGFLDTTRMDEGFKRCTFMVRFRAGTGELVGATGIPPLVFAPTNDSTGRTGIPFSDPALRADKAEDPVRFVRTVVAGLRAPPNPRLTEIQKRELIGRLSSDMVMARPVMQLALYNETKLATAFGASGRLDPDTESLYVAFGGTPYINAGRTVTGTDITRWIEGDSDFNNTAGDTDDLPEARLFGVDRYSGALRTVEVQK